MVYWKIDNETIRCLINKDEISQLGYDLNSLSKDSSLMSDFLDTIVKDSHKYIDWNTENGVQNYIARALPADQFLLTISCTFPEDAINQDLKQIKKIFEALNRKVSKERIEQIGQMTGEEKEKAFQDLSRDLRDAYMGKSDEDVKEETGSYEASATSDEAKTAEKASSLPPQKMIFKDMDSLLEFASLLDKRLIFPSRLYRDRDRYILLLDIKEGDDNVDIITLIITAEEFGAVVESQNFSPYYLKEHADLLIGENALSVLRSFSN